MLHKDIIAIFILIGLAIGCTSVNNNKTPYAYIGGEIINPKNKAVILYDNDGNLVDSIQLNVNNRFLHKIENLNSGIYLITHGGEFQTVLLEPKDSIMFRLNTFDFDESLVFTGEGAKKNNYLLKTYISNEKEARKSTKYAQMEPEQFGAFVEKRRLNRLSEFQDFLSKNEESDFFKSLIEANINYNTYADKEMYPFAYFGENKLIHIKDLPEDFYAYRASIDYNAQHLSHFWAYNRFLFYHINNLAIDSYYQQHPYHSRFDRHSLTYNISKLDIIDSIIDNEKIKNNILKYKARDFISHNHTEQEAEELLNHYLSKSTNNDDKTYMIDLVQSLKSLRQGNPLPDLDIVNYNNSENNLTEVISKPSIIYFWSSDFKKQYRNSHYVVSQLKKKFKNVDFISINVNDNDDKYWKDIIGNYNFPTEKEFKFKNSRKAQKTLVVNYLNKAIIVDGNGLILHPNVDIFKSDFEDILEELLQKKHLM